MCINVVSWGHKDAFPCAWCLEATHARITWGRDGTQPSVCAGVLFTTASGPGCARLRLVHRERLRCFRPHKRSRISGTNCRRVVRPHSSSQPVRTMRSSARRAARTRSPAKKPRLGDAYHQTRCDLIRLRLRPGRQTRDPLRSQCVRPSRSRRCTFASGAPRAPNRLRLISSALTDVV